MTNEEKLYQIFPDGVCPFSRVWLSEEYQEPTTNNDLGVDCISRADAIDTIRQLYLDLATQKAVIDLLKILPSVTPQEPILDKIRAEIKELQPYFHEMLILDEVMQIIDKYKAETADT